MFIIVGAVIVLVCVFGAYSVHGNMLILIQPVEFVIILGAALGAFIIGNTKTNIKQTLKGLKRALKGPTYKKGDYIELLSVLYQLFKLAQAKGLLALEPHSRTRTNLAFRASPPSRRTTMRSSSSATTCAW